MTDLGPESLLINAQDVKLFTNSGNDEYIQLYNIRPHMGIPEERRTTTDGGVQYFYGSGDHWFEAEFGATTDQINALNNRVGVDSLGNAQVFAYTIVFTAKSGAKKTMSVECVLRDFEPEAPEEGPATMKGFFRIIGNTVTIT